MHEEEDYYYILGLNNKASDDQIKAAYKRLAKQYHPDKNLGNVASENIFKNINIAYQTLSDPWKRMTYDFKKEHIYQPHASLSPPPNNIKASDLMWDRIKSIKPMWIASALLAFIGFTAIVIFQLMSGYTAQHTYEEGLLLQQNKQWISAHYKFTEAIEEDDNFADAYFQRAEVCNKIKNKRIGSPYNYQRAIFFDPTNVSYRYALANYHYLQADYALADLQLDTLLAISPTENSAWYLKGEINLQNGQDHEQTISYFQKAIDLKLKTEKVYVGIANAQLKAKLFKAAIASLNDAIRLNKNNGKYYYLRGKAKLGLKYSKSANKDFAKARTLGCKD